jgi:aconitate hydratase
MPDNITMKILKAHLVGGDTTSGTEMAMAVDQTLLQDATGTMASLQFEELQRDRVGVPLAVQYIDHNMIQLDYKNPDDHRYLQAFDARYGLYYSRPGNGICHYVHVERFARPGQTLIGADSHTTTSGALAMIAIGAGGLDVAVCMAGLPFEFETPRVVGVELRGELPEWVQAKDVILELLRRRGVRNGLGRIFEFYGEGVGTLDVFERMTICNMIVEMGATTGLFPSDAKTREWCEQQQRPGDWLELQADPGATYDEHELIELDQLEPLIAKPSSPGSVVPVREVAGTKAAQVCFGSSVNSGYADLALPAAVLRGQVINRGLVTTLTPGSRQILDIITEAGVLRDLIRSGVRILEPACGPCVGMGQAPPSGAVSVRTFNRNFPGRSGTQNDKVYLCSPATAAATALTGVITDPRELGRKEPSLPKPKFNPAADDDQIIAPLPLEEARAVELPRGPNIQASPPQIPMPAHLNGRVLIVVGDDISTGDLSPDGAEVMAFRSNISAMANYVFRRLDPEFASRAREWGGGFIVGGLNYGQGSSREHAALAPKQLGVVAVIAKSFARIHRRNLIAQGLPPLTFADPLEHDQARQGETWEMPNLAEQLAAGATDITVRVVEEDREFTVRANFSPRERRMLINGGMLAHIKAGGKMLSAEKAQSAAVDQGSPVTNPVPEEITSE